MIRVEFDERSWHISRGLTDFGIEFRSQMRHKLAPEIAHRILEWIQPLLHVRAMPSTGALEHSFEPQYQETATGVDISFMALFYGLYMDQGNDNGAFPLEAQDFGMKYFPVDYRLGAQYFDPHVAIHPMGSQTPGVPTHWSERAVTYMAGGPATELALDMVMHLFTEVVR